MPKKTTTKTKTKKTVKKTIKKIVKKKEVSRYLETVGRRKTAVARVRVWPKEKAGFIVNGKDYKEYFPIVRLQKTAAAALEAMKCLDQFKVQVLVKGGGVGSQAGAIRHGTARALVSFNDDFRKRLRNAGYLTRDPRMRER